MNNEPDYDNLYFERKPMTQKIFDTDNAEDMALLWSILPDKADTIKRSYFGCQIWYNKKAKCGYNLECIKINWHNKTEITRPIQEATEADLGKLCYFWDNCCEDIIIGKLTVVERNKGHTHYRLGNYAVFDHCRRLTKQEIEELI